MKMNISDIIEKFCSERDNVSFYENYSGRFMYGKKCVGIVIDSSVYEVIVELCDYLHEMDVFNASEALGRISSDNMGLSYIIYFRDISPKS